MENVWFKQDGSHSTSTNAGIEGDNKHRPRTLEDLQKAIYTDIRRMPQENMIMKVPCETCRFVYRNVCIMSNNGRRLIDHIEIL